MAHIQATLRKIYLFCALDDFVLLYPFYTIFMAAKGLSLFQISSLLIIWSAVDLLVNVPAGVLADKYSRKNLLALGQMFKAAGFAVWYLYPHYLGFALGFMLWGIGGAFTGGTFEALVYDELKAVDRQQSYVKVIGRTDSAALGGNLLASLVAGAAILLGYGFLFGASIVVTIAAALLALSFPETPRFETVADTRYFVMLKAGIKEALGNRTILAIILLGGFIGAMYGSLEEYVALFVRQTGISLSLVSLAVAATVAAAAMGSFVAYRYEKLSTRHFMMILATAGGLLLVAGASGKAFSIVLLVGYSLLIRMLQAIFDGKLQHSITGGLRATIGSFGGLVIEIMSIATYLIYGLVADPRGNFGAFMTFGALIIFVAVVYLLTTPRILSKQALRSN